MRPINKYKTLIGWESYIKELWKALLDRPTAMSFPYWTNEYAKWHIKVLEGLLEEGKEIFKKEKKQDKKIIVKANQITEIITSAGLEKFAKESKKITKEEERRNKQRHTIQNEMIGIIDKAIEEIKTKN